MQDLNDRWLEGLLFVSEAAWNNLVISMKATESWQPSSLISFETGANEQGWTLT